MHEICACATRYGIIFVPNAHSDTPAIAVVYVVDNLLDEADDGTWTAGSLIRMEALTSARPSELARKSETSARSGSMVVEVARLGRNRFENVGAVECPEVEDSVRPRGLILSMQSIDGCSSDGGSCEHCQSQYDRSIHDVFL